MAERDPFVCERAVELDCVDAVGIAYFARILDACHRAFEAFLVSIDRPLRETRRESP